MANSDMPTVKLGSTGEPVRQAQRALRRTPRTTIEIDGVFGPSTDTATKDFQRTKGLPVTGVVDAATFQTWAGLAADGIVGQYTWTAFPLALEFTVGLQHVVKD